MLSAVYKLFQDHLMNDNKDYFFVVMCVCLELGWSPLSENEKNFLNPAHCLSYFHHSGSHLSSLFTAECTIMTYFASFFKSERILPNIRMFWFSVQNTSSCLLTVSQTTKAPIYSAIPLNHRAVCSIFLLAVSIVLIMHGACAHRAPLLILLRGNLFLGLGCWRCSACVWITASSLSQSPAPTCTSPQMNSPAAHYWRHFTVV